MFFAKRPLVTLGLVAGLGGAAVATEALTRVQEATATIQAGQTGSAPGAVHTGETPDTLNISDKGAARPGNPLWKIPLSSLTATRERPLFSPSRRPPAIVNAAPEPSTTVAVAGPNRPRLLLVGAIAGDTESIAIFIDSATKSVIRLRTGESHAGWELRAVNGQQVTLLNDRQTMVLVLPSTPAK
jgi:general secretion pathway protein N